MAKERLQKVMARAGVASRRKSEEIIANGRVKVNGKVVTELGTKVNPQKDTIVVDGKEIEKERLVYLLLNKPQGFITTVNDPRNRATVMELITDVKQTVHPVGRLDRDTKGLLLLTNDGDLTYALTHPSHEVAKTYMATVEGTPNPNTIEALERGIKLKDGWTAPAEAKVVADLGDRAIVSLTIHEGRKHQVKRMWKSVGHPVQELKRTNFGPLDLEGVPEGRYRHLNKDEVRELKEIEKEVADNESK
ncbi:MULTISPECIES: pseudouridine synthase [unclassified Candidatus Frackibacter]|uniref:pseudouridine synthase n=1 Tax=unclassified Candidatus Frackibacter TaxID=2648818 RepID=UPI00079C0AD5|nr:MULTISPECIES: pseudouridine synthase [unclassified Candidatus Frackibacter]KXS45469.1 MAG: 23S rRNA pseudouridine synthase [Candidatus Frackibacter sp. T328-2]SDC01144.1 ribosomal large subunit pseudouridine synthase B [Candidatus Frackibacter sp. WG11]SEM32461.1 ribosomal large subunit pseudouridine synthase B [Candidatus Frackibacter sp. WG12]SFL37395.1 ribosomal large subunit pseudouridine synthase B [Candidatus Frackibacter sp. WG13]